MAAAVLLCTTPDEAEAFGARRHYHSYHHFQSRSNRSSLKQTSQEAKPSSNLKASISSQDETEMLLERAAKIRELSRQIQNVQLTSRNSLIEREREKSQEKDDGFRSVITG